jgi:NADH:ubiquinone oxidoreductase subunit 6 (subunit J)
MQTLAANVAEWLIIVFIGAVALIVLVNIYSGKIDLKGLLAEATGKASLSRLQLLLFTFVIAGLYLILCLEAGEFVEIPNQVLGLLGISGASYVVSKGIQMNK